MLDIFTVLYADSGTRSFDEFAFHLHTNTIGPIITAQKLLKTNIPIGTITFMSSDSGSQGNFREMEDGFAAYAASKAALNMAVRHMAAELKRKDDDTIILCMHPGEVATDMSNLQRPWEIHGIITPEESVMKMIEVIKSKGIQHSGTFWTYENKVSCSFLLRIHDLTPTSHTSGDTREARTCISLANSPLVYTPIATKFSYPPQ
jgi:NAD(P)-dependent dehydrogenase (short-subunit alcohol dehydrogenase family)